MAWLTIRTNDGADPMTSQDLLDFTFRGERFRLMDAQAGIRKPQGWTAALSIRTVYTPAGRARPYDDGIGSDGLVHYKWRGTDPNHADNRALRAAMEQRVPLIWFFGVGTALYQPIYSIYVVREEPSAHQFSMAPGDVGSLLPHGSSIIEESLKRYVMREVRYRLHQPVFRATVLRAYGNQCAVCAIRHSQLLDAAHIVADRLDEGIPSVRNGLAMCKIHHAAYDSKILGIRPDCVVEIRTDILEEVDGPMLRYGIQSCHGMRLRFVPRSRSECPSPELLGQTYAQFLRSGGLPAC